MGKSGYIGPILSTLPDIRTLPCEGAVHVYVKTVQARQTALGHAWMEVKTAAGSYARIDFGPGAGANPIGGRQGNADMGSLCDESDPHAHCWSFKDCDYINHDAIYQWIVRFKQGNAKVSVFSSGSNYSGLIQNCAATVAHALNAGSDRIFPLTNQGFNKLKPWKWRLTWTPDDIIGLCKEAVKRIRYDQREEGVHPLYSRNRNCHRLWF
ncbi:MAG: hypothetical protein FWG73_02600 [Planctomycetaceae bacterium]|nr:hypothetical protein [Planctomycetaceae bacterium]